MIIFIDFALRLTLLRDYTKKDEIVGIFNMQGQKNTNKILVEKPFEKNPLVRAKFKDNIKVDTGGRDCEYLDWLKFPQIGTQLWVGLIKISEILSSENYKPHKEGSEL